MRLDADDWLKKDALKEMFKIIDKNDETAMVFPDYYEVDINGKKILRFVRHNFKKVDLKDQPAHGACSLIRLSILKKIGGYDEKFMCQDGFYIWMKLLKYKVKNNLAIKLFIKCFLLNISINYSAGTALPSKSFVFCLVFEAFSFSACFTASSIVSGCLSGVSMIPNIGKIIIKYANQ